MTFPTPEEYIAYLEKRLEALQKDSDFLGALRAAGVDNWDGYEYACDLFHGDDALEVG